MIDYERVPEPPRIPGQPGWEWARRYADAFPRDVLRRIIVAAIKARRRKVRKGYRPTPLWGYVRDSSGHGGTVSSALVERWRDERAWARVERILARPGR